MSSALPRVLLTTVFRPFCVDGPFDMADNQVQHGTCHRQFTREQGVFTIQQQCSHLGLHLIAGNIDAETVVVEYPSVEELRELLGDAVREGRPFDFVGVTSTASYIRKARHICELVREVSPTSETVVGGGGVLAIGDVIEPFADHACQGEGVTFFRRLLGQDPDAPIQHPPVWSVHFPNQILGSEANSAGYSLAVAVGCHRRCDFCSTSAQFGGKRVRILKTGAEILAAMKAVEAELAAAGERPPSLAFAIFDENFLSDDELARELQALNREELTAGRLYLPLLFSDAEAVRRFEPEELLEMGIDALWIGLETTSAKRFAKNREADFAALVRELQSHGIKVFVSFLAGLEEQTLADIDRDIEVALTLGAAAYQYAIICPLPGTAYYARLKRQGRLAVERPEQLNMGHYYIRHPELDQSIIRERTIDFQRRDYERHGPLALRYVRLRLDGYARHRRSANPALRTRARGFRNDAMDAAGAISVGPSFAPSDEVRRLFVETRRRLHREVPLGEVLADVARGRATPNNVAQWLLFTHPVVEPLARQVALFVSLRWDPRSRERCRTLAGFLRHRRACIAEVGHGMQPWDQPRLAVTRYPKAPPERRTPRGVARLLSPLRRLARVLSAGQPAGEALS